jgi:CheY-like chemotaxis protein
MLMNQIIHILLVEDNPGDADLTRLSLESETMCLEIFVVEDGANALDFLFRQGVYATAFRPDLIMLDLNIPKIDGHHVLNATTREVVGNRVY